MTANGEKLGGGTTSAQVRVVVLAHGVDSGRPFDLVMPVELYEANVGPDLILSYPWLSGLGLDVLCRRGGLRTSSQPGLFIPCERPSPEDSGCPGVQAQITASVVTSAAQQPHTPLGRVRFREPMLEVANSNYTEIPETNCSEQFEEPFDPDLEWTVLHVRRLQLDPLLEGGVTAAWIKPAYILWPSTLWMQSPLIPS